MAEEPNDVIETPAVDAPADDKPIEDPIMDILTEGTENPTKPVSSTGKDEKSQVADKSEDEAKGDDTPAKTDDEVKAAEGKDKPPEGDKPDDGVTPPPDKPVDDAQPQDKVATERKQQLNTEIRDLVATRNALKTDIEKINAEFYQPATEEQLVEAGLSATDAKLEALNQRLEVKDYNDKVAEAQLTIESEAQAVLRDFPMFDQNNKAYNKELAEEAATLFNDSIIRDENTGQVIGSNLSPYKLYKALAASHASSVQTGQVKGQKATEDMLSRADSTPDAAPKVAKKDPIMAILEDVDGD